MNILPNWQGWMLANTLTPIPAAVLRKRQMIYTPIAIAILAIFSYGFYFFVGYETTAVTTLPAGVNSSSVCSADVYSNSQLYLQLPLQRLPRFLLRLLLPPQRKRLPFLLLPHLLLRLAAVTWDSAIGPLFTQKCLMCHGAIGFRRIKSFHLCRCDERRGVWCSIYTR